VQKPQVNEADVLRAAPVGQQVTPLIPEAGAVNTAQRKVRAEVGGAVDWWFVLQKE